MDPWSNEPRNPAPAGQHTAAAQVRRAVKARQRRESPPVTRRQRLALLRAASPEPVTRSAVTVYLRALARDRRDGVS